MGNEYFKFDNAKFFFVQKEEKTFDILKVIYNDPATIVFWGDGTKTVVKCQEGDDYSPRMGLLYCIAKKAFGNTGRFNDVIEEHIPVEEKLHPAVAKFLRACGVEVDPNRVFTE